MPIRVIGLNAYHSMYVLVVVFVLFCNKCDAQTLLYLPAFPLLNRKQLSADV